MKLNKKKENRKTIMNHFEVVELRENTDITNGRKEIQNTEKMETKSLDAMIYTKTLKNSNKEGKEKIVPKEATEKPKKVNGMEIPLGKIKSSNSHKKQDRNSSYTPRSSGLITTRNGETRSISTSLGKEDLQNNSPKTKKPKNRKFKSVSKKTNKTLKIDSSIDKKPQKKSSVQMNCNPTEQLQQLNADKNSLSQIYEDSDSDLLRFQFNENERKIMTTREIDVRNKLSQIAPKNKVKKLSITDTSKQINIK